MPNVTGPKAPAQTHFHMPTHDQMVKTYGGIVRGALKEGTAKKMAHAPTAASLKGAPVYDITPKKLMGMKSEVFLIKGDLYLKQSPVVMNPKPTWYHVGPAPLF
jgi:hypothetical protein